ncbi:MAG: glycosyltransferase family 4 protein [Opitutaceae bacterium]|jgi:glycosyltransferase involved in cell wall biosynthesis
MSRPLSIGLLTPALAGVTGPDSGIGVHFRHLADGLAAAGQRVSVVVVTDQPARPTDVFPYEIKSVRVRPPVLAKWMGKFSWQFHQWLTLRAGLRAAAGAAAQTPVDAWETSSTGSLALRFLRCPGHAPVAVRISTTAAQLRATNAGDRRWIDGRIEACESATVHRADRLLTHSVAHRAIIARQFGLAPDLIPIIPHGLPMPPTPIRTAQAGRCRILYVGRLEHRKGIDLLFSALPSLLRAAPSADLTLVGADRDDFWKKCWRQTAPAGFEDRVHFAGVVDAAALIEHYRAADMFVAPSRYESFGLIFVEAMSHALPVVALRAPGAIDLIEHGVTGLLAPPEDPAGLAGTLTQLASDPGLRLRLGAAGRRMAEERYSLPALAAASLAFYRDMLVSR